MPLKNLLTSAAIFVVAACTICVPPAAAKPAGQAAASASVTDPLTLAGSTDFPGYTGDFDHFAIDPRDNRMFLAGEEHHELEVMNLSTGALERRLTGYGAPHSPFYLAKTNELLVIDGEKPSPVLDAATLKVKRSYAFPAGADSAAYDAGTGRLWIVTGGKDVPQKDSNLIAVDLMTGKTLQTLHFDADHVEALAIEQHGPKLFINVTDKNYLAVIDKASAKVVNQWKIAEAEQNAPIAYDEKTRRLFVITRKPGKLVILNADTGATVAVFPAPLRVDQVTWDAENRRIYVPGGEGYTSVIEQDGPDQYRDVAHVTTLPGAKTSILDPVHHRLWIAASPGDTGAMGKVLWFDVKPR